MDAGLGQQRFERDPIFLLVRGKLGDRAIDPVELFGGREPIDALRCRE